MRLTPHIRDKSIGDALFKQRDVMLVAGAAPCLFDDLEKFWGMGIGHSVCCVNMVALLYPCDFEHFVALDDPERDAELRMILARVPDDVVKHTAVFHRVEDVDRRFGVAWESDGVASFPGTSALFGVRVALAMGCKVALAGVPISNEGNFYNNELSPDREDIHLQAWEAFSVEGHPVRSFSGKTKELMGEPTKEWFAE